MSNSASDEESILNQEISNTIKSQFRPYEIDLMIKIYRFTKSNKNPYVKLYMLKRFHNYKKALKRFKNEGYVFLHKGKEPYGITRFGMDIGRAMLELKELGFL